MRLLRLWLIATAVFLGGALIWGFVPILVPFILVFIGLTGVVAVIVGLARALERRRKAGTDNPDVRPSGDER